MPYTTLCLGRSVEASKPWGVPAEGPGHLKITFAEDFDLTGKINPGRLKFSAAGRRLIVESTPPATDRGTLGVLVLFCDKLTEAWQGCGEISFYNTEGDHTWVALDPHSKSIVYQAAQIWRGKLYVAAILKVTAPVYIQTTTRVASKKSWSIHTIYPDGRIETESLESFCAKLPKKRSTI